MTFTPSTIPKGRPKTRPTIKAGDRSGYVRWMQFCYRRAWAAGAERWRWRP